MLVAGVEEGQKAGVIREGDPRRLAAALTPSPRTGYRRPAVTLSLVHWSSSC